MIKLFNRLKCKLVLAICSILFLSSALAATYTEDQLPVLSQDDIHSVVSRRVTNYFTQSHYQDFSLDGAFSSKIFDRYLKLLDGNKSIFIKDDINQFRERQSLLRNELRDGDLTTAYDLYNLSLKKRFARYQYALSLLDAPIDFSTDDEIDFKRDDIDWPTSEDELDLYWQKRVKYDQLSLALTGKDEADIHSILSKRYNRVLRTLTQTNIEDAFQVFMNAFAREIDPHTSYLAPRKKRDFDSEMSLSFEGIGATLNQEDDYTVILSFVSGGPAEKSQQLVIGDRIIGVGQKGKEIEDVIGWRLDDIVELIRGPKGSVVRLEILPAGNDSQPKIVELTRDKIHFDDREAKLEIIDNERGKVGVIDIPSFYMGLTEKVAQLLADVNRANVDSIVIDLRNNGGGSLAEVISLTGLFIEKGPVVQVKDSLQKVVVYDDRNESIHYNGPVVVMVNRYSASASEIFSAALQDYSRAIIIGETTYGKGTVQTSRSIAYPVDRQLHPDWPELGGVQYTVQKFYRINGGSTQLKGVVPDIEMTRSQYVDETGERFLDNAMIWDKIKPAIYTPLHSNMVDVIVKLQAKHQQRISDNPEFAYIEEDIARYNQRKETQYIVSLNKEKRQAELQENDQRELARTNERLARLGLPQVEKMDELPDAYKMPDVYLDESIEVALDLVSLYPKIDNKQTQSQFNRVFELSQPIAPKK